MRHGRNAFSLSGGGESGRSAWRSAAAGSHLRRRSQAMQRNVSNGGIMWRRQ